MSSIAHLIHVYGLLVVAGLIGLESVGLPFPGETVLIVASVIAGTKHDLNIASVILTAAGASIIGRMIGYVIGREFGYRPPPGNWQSRWSTRDYLLRRQC